MRGVHFNRNHSRYCNATVYGDGMFRNQAFAVVDYSSQDTGCGMTPEEQKSLFNAFYQVDPSITRTHGGTGT